MRLILLEALTTPFAAPMSTSTVAKSVKAMTDKAKMRLFRKVPVGRQALDAAEGIHNTMAKSAGMMSPATGGE